MAKTQNTKGSTVKGKAQLPSNQEKTIEAVKVENVEAVKAENVEAVKAEIIEAVTKEAPATEAIEETDEHPDAKYWWYGSK